MSSIHVDDVQDLATSTARICATLGIWTEDDGWADEAVSRIERLSAIEQRARDLKVAGPKTAAIARYILGEEDAMDECYACVVGVATGPESHAEDCPARNIPMPVQDGQWGPEWDEYDRRVAEAKAAVR
jgi:hypothetical protein